MKKTILINILLAVFLGSYSKNVSPLVSIKVGRALDLLNIPEFSNGSGNELSLLCALRDIVLRLLNRPAGTKIDTDEFLMSLENVSIYHQEVVGFIKSKITDVNELEEDELGKRVGYYIKEINNFINVTEISKLSTKLSFDIRECQNNGDLSKVSELVKEFEQESEKYRSRDNGEFNPLGHISGIREVSGTGNKDSLISAMKDAEVTYEGEGLISFGLSGWNDALGPNRAAPRGVLIEIQALSGRSKSETMRRLLSDVCIHNSPYLFNENAKPIVMYFTAEDTTAECWNKLYTQFWCEENGSFPEDTISVEEKTQYCIERLTVKGIHFEIISCRKNQTTIEDCIEVMEHYRTSGWEIIACGIDYMALFSHDHYSSTMLDTFKIQRKHSVIGGYGKEHKILTFVANQLGSAPAIELDSVEENFAREAARQNFNVGSNRILDELDGRIVVNVKEGANRKWYHQFATSKLRWAKGWPQANRYCCYEMHNIDGLAAGFIKTDLGEESRACHDMGGGLKSGKGGGAAYF